MINNRNALVAAELLGDPYTVRVPDNPIPINCSTSSISVTGCSVSIPRSAWAEQHKQRATGRIAIRFNDFSIYFSVISWCDARVVITCWNFLGAPSTHPFDKRMPSFINNSGGDRFPRYPGTKALAEREADSLSELLPSILLTGL